MKLSHALCSPQKPTSTAWPWSLHCSSVQVRFVWAVVLDFYKTYYGTLQYPSSREFRGEMQCDSELSAEPEKFSESRSSFCFVFPLCSELPHGGIEGDVALRSMLTGTNRAD